MAQPSISVLVLTYHPQKQALFSTLRSIVLQKDCNYEVIVADDGSGDFFEEEIRAFLDGYGCSYQIVAHQENQGTVKNIIDGLQQANGKYVKPISPGDYLYDDSTLRDAVSFMEQRNAKAAFGKMVFYYWDGGLQVKNLVHPYLDDIYRTTPYPYKKAIKQQVEFNDFISGASAVYETEAFAQALETISPAVRFAEDAVFQLFALKHIPIYAMSRYVVWYEHGSGISTQKTAQSFGRIDTDFYNFYYHMAKLFPESPYVRRACALWELRKAGKRGLIKKFRPDKLLFSLRVKLRRKTLHITDYKDDFFRQCHGGK